MRHGRRAAAEEPGPAPHEQPEHGDRREVADDPDHAANAARAALDCCTQLAELNASSDLFREYKLAQRIGINSGEALVGNFGSRRRFNYSVMSDAVNLASRLESHTKVAKRAILIDGATREGVRDTFAFEPLGFVFAIAAASTLSCGSSRSARDSHYAMAPSPATRRARGSIHLVPARLLSARRS